MVPALDGLSNSVPVTTFPKESATFPLASGKLPFTFCTDPVTSPIAIFETVVKGLAPFAFTKPVRFEAPVPPLATFTTAVTFAALPIILPDILDPETVTIFSSVTAAVANFAVVIDALEMIGADAVEPTPAKSPDNCNLPLVVASASTIVPEATFAST